MFNAPSIRVKHRDPHFVVAGAQVDPPLFENHQAIFVANNAMWSKSPYHAWLVDGFQEEEPAGLELPVDLLQDGQVVVFVLKIAKRCEYVNDRVKLVFERDCSHITLNTPGLDCLYFNHFQ